jgi:hypothetical protein
MKGELAKTLKEPADNVIGRFATWEREQKILRMESFILQYELTEALAHRAVE